MHEKYGQDLAHVLPVYKSAEKFPVLLLVPILRDLYIFLKPVLRVGNGAAYPHIGEVFQHSILITVPDFGRMAFWRGTRTDPMTARPG